MALVRGLYALGGCFLSATLGLLYLTTLHYPMLSTPVPVVYLPSEEDTVNSMAWPMSEDPLCLEERQVSWFTHPELYQATDACFDFAALFGQTCQRNTTKLQFHIAVMRRQQWNEPNFGSTAFTHKAELAFKSLLSAEMEWRAAPLSCGRTTLPSAFARCHLMIGYSDPHSSLLRNETGWLRLCQQ